MWSDAPEAIVCDRKLFLPLKRQEMHEFDAFERELSAVFTKVLYFDHV